jgi:hypothetical protein
MNVKDMVPHGTNDHLLFKALYSDSITLHLIETGDLADVCLLLQGYPDSRDMLAERLRHYLSQYETVGESTMAST